MTLLRSSSWGRPDRFALCVLAALSFAASSAVAQQTKESHPPLGTASFIPPESKKHEPLTPENFVVRAAVTNLAEIQASELALEKSADKAVRTLASRLLRDHRAAQAQLKSIATETKTALPGTVDDDTRKQQEQLESLVGADFDRAYVEMMHHGHTRALELFQQSSNANLPPSFKRYASDTAKLVEGHRAEIEQLRDRRTR